MQRRRLLTSALGALAAGTIAAPAIGQPARAIRFIPYADVANFDPVWNVSYIARNAGLLVWDTLYGVDDRIVAQRQMVENEEVSADGLTWTFRLRSGLMFHDGTPVLARDAVASINRWAARDPMGLMIKANENELAVTDDRTFRWALRTPFPKMKLALGKMGTPCCFIMPERIARTEPSRQIGEYVGSGPARFMRAEWRPGDRAVFESFAGYVPRDEPASWMAGGKRLAFDRIEWLTIPDPATAAAAVQNGEVDWLERTLPDLLPLLRRNPKLVVEPSDSFGQFGGLMFNHLHPPFNDRRARRAVLTALSQEDYMTASVGGEKWKPMPGYFTPGAPLYTEAGGDILKGKRDMAAARKLLAESGYAGETIVCMAAQDIATHKSWGDITVAMLRDLGVKVDFVAADWGTVVSRRAQKALPSQGGWHLYHSAFAGMDAIDPTLKLIRAAGNQFLNGWARSQAVEAEVAAWYSAGSADEEKASVARLNEAALDEALYAPLGLFLSYHTYRNGLTGLTPSPSPLFWGVSRTS